jgi:chemotaxis protein CheD
MSLCKVSLPKVLPGFENSHCFWEAKWERYTVKVLPGEFYISKEDIVLSTVLGSCISVCIYDPLLDFGGMNHFMLPASSEQDDIERPLRYGLFAMEQLINGMMKNGCTRENMQIKVTGGGALISGLISIGTQNINFIKKYIVEENLQLISIDLGGDQARRVAYFPKTGRMLVKKLSHLDDQHLITQESTYRTNVDKSLDDTEIELF